MVSAQRAPALSAEPRARVLVALTFTAGTLIAAVLGFYALMTVGGIADLRAWPWVASTLLLFGAAVAFVLVWGADWLPHAPTRALLALLKDAGADGKDSAARALQIATCGSALVVLIVVLYVAALTWLASPVLRADATAVTADHVDELSRRFERLTTLSYVASLAFAFAVLTLTALLQWPQAIPGLGPAVGHTATAITALFGAYLTAVLTGAFLPAATRLENQAELAARLATRILTPSGAELTCADTLPARRKWLADRGLTVFSTTRVGAAMATLLPLLAGAVSSLSGAATTLAGALR